MGTVIVNALIKVIAKNPTLVENLVEAGLNLLATELAKKAAATPAA